MKLKLSKEEFEIIASYFGFHLDGARIPDMKMLIITRETMSAALVAVKEIKQK